MDSKDERIAFLEQQLAGAVMHLRQKDASEDACIARLEAFYKERFDGLQAERDRIRESYQESIKQLGLYAMRYDLVRQYTVRIRELDILCRGLALDHELDKLIERTRRQAELAAHPGLPALIEHDTSGLNR